MRAVNRQSRERSASRALPCPGVPAQRNRVGVFQRFGLLDDREMPQTRLIGGAVAPDDLPQVVRAICRGVIGADPSSSALAILGLGARGTLTADAAFAESDKSQGVNGASTI